jgi:hypothetical protein
MRGTVALAFAIVGLGCQEPELPPPPIPGGTGPVVPPIGGNGPEGGDASGTRGSGTLDSGDTFATVGTPDIGDTATAGTTTAGHAVLVTGLLLAGTTTVVPITCNVRLHLPEFLDPDTGLPGEFVHEEPVPVRALPQAYTVFMADGDFIGPGDSVYVSTLCDVDGDGAPDTVGGYYPGVPVEPVELPASNVDIPLDELQ